MKNSYKLYQEITQERGISSYRVALSTGIPESCFSQWKHRDIVPKYDRMSRIAEFLSTPERPLTASVFYIQDQEQDQNGGTK